MKKLNRKGFTLIELMVVIAILVVIMGIALPNITSSIERSKQKQLEAKKQLIASAGELYFDRHKGDCDVRGVSLDILVSEEYLTAAEIDDICNDSEGVCCARYQTTSKKYIYDEGKWCRCGVGITENNSYVQTNPCPTSSCPTH